MTMIMIDKAVIEQVAEWLEWFHSGNAITAPQSSRQVMESLVTALEQPQAAQPQPQPVQEPVAHCELTKSGSIAFFDGRPMVMVGPIGNDCHPQPLYTSPQAQPAQPLSDKLEQIEAAVKELADTLEDLADYAGAFSVSGVYLVEDKHARALLAQAYKLVLKYDN